MDIHSLVLIHRRQHLSISRDDGGALGYSRIAEKANSRVTVFPAATAHEA